jgi:hypothetical protein
MKRRNFFASALASPMLMLNPKMPSLSGSVCKTERIHEWMDAKCTPGGRWLWGFFDDPGNGEFVEIVRAESLGGSDGELFWRNPYGVKIDKCLLNWMDIPKPVSPTFSKPTGRGSYVLDTHRKCSENGVEWFCPSKAPVGEWVWIVHCIDAVTIGRLWEDKIWSAGIYTSISVTHWTPIIPRKPEFPPLDFSNAKSHE